MKVTKFTFRQGDVEVFTGTYDECVDFCKDGGYTHLETYTYNGDVIQERWAGDADNAVYRIS